MAEKQKYYLEYLVKASIEMLYPYISTASGLGEWFSEAASSKGSLFTFIWAGSQEEAALIARRENTLARFRWKADEGEKYYFEIRIEQDELTGDVSMMITDFAYPHELEQARQLWNSSVANLRRVIGAQVA